MISHPHSVPKPALATNSRALPTIAAVPCAKLTALKAQAKVLKKWRKQERVRFFNSWCAGFHALGFCF